MSAAGPAIDLRSDTVTRPDEAMRRAMAAAEVGDDVYGEDPTVNLLQEEVAAAVGTAAALFVPTGTMGNQIALHLLAGAGSAVICEARSHVVVFEGESMAVISRLHTRTLAAAAGLLQPPAVEAAISAPAVAGEAEGNAGAAAPAGLIVVENSHSLAGGTVYDRSHLESLLDVARRHRLPIHLDGARLWNAAVALGTSVAALARGFDSVMVCLSKGLGAPVGSLLCGSRELIAEGRRVRRMLGGGMRQAGVLAAAGRVALAQGPARLAADHANAARLAHALAALPGLAVDPATVRTNIVVCRVAGDGSDGDGEAGGIAEGGPAGGGASPDGASRDTGSHGGSSRDAVSSAGPAAAFLARARAAGVLAGPVDAERVRFVTHRDVGAADVEEAVHRLTTVCAAGNAG